MGVVNSLAIEANKIRESARKEISSSVYFGLIIVFILEYLRPNNHLPILNAIKINTITPLAVFLIAFVSSNGPSTREIINDRNTRLLIAFLLMLCISVFGAEVRFYAFKVFIAILGFSLIYYSVRKLVTSEGRMKGVFLSYIIIHVILIGINPDVFLHPETRNYLTNAGYLGDGNDFALSICMVIPMSYYFVSRSKDKYLRLLSVVAMVLFCLCVISTQSRGGTITLAVVLLYLVMCSRKKLLGIIILAMLVVSALIYAPEQYYERMDRIANYEQDGSAQGRILAWKSAIRMAMDDPLLGVGAGNFPTSYGTQYRPEGYGRTDLPWQTAHSIYFLALGELGIPGLLFLLTLIGSNIIIITDKLRTIRNTDTGKTENAERILVSLNGSIIAYAVGGAFLSVLYYPHIYILIGLISCGMSIAEQNVELHNAQNV